MKCKYASPVKTRNKKEHKVKCIRDGAIRNEHTCQSCKFKELTTWQKFLDRIGYM